MTDCMEIERKFLVVGDGWKNEASAKKIAQGYISNDKEHATVVRVRQKGDKCFLTLKADRGGITRLEFEYEIPKTDCDLMLRELCGAPIEKTRYTVNIGGKTWEIDEFHGVNDGLVVAEIELNSENEPFEKPDWAGPEVSHDHRFFNSYISEHPFDSWDITPQDLLKQFNRS
jgi:adenylate cyclase